jgi:hypothetical protein
MGMSKAEKQAHYAKFHEEQAAQQGKESIYTDGEGAPLDKKTMQAQQAERELRRFPTADEGVAAQVVKLRERVKTALGEHLTDGETIQVVIRGLGGQAIVGTKTRAIVLKPGWRAGATFGAEVTAWGYKNLLGVQVHKGMLTGAVVLQGPGQTGRSTSAHRNKDDDPHKAPNAIPINAEWNLVKAGAAKLGALIDSAHSGADSPQPPPAATSMADELAKLGELRNSGVLSDEEFSVAKQRLLDGE